MTSAGRTLGALLFPDFELLDVCGPLEVFGNQSFTTPLFRIVTVAEAPGPVPSSQGPKLEAELSLDGCPPLDVLFVPGGMGTRGEVGNQRLLEWIAARAATAELVLSVCTGAALLARAGVLDGRRATTNKRAFDWVTTQGPRVEWVRQARWVEDDRFFTSSGVSAGLDMALQVVARLAGRGEAERLTRIIEYNWQSDSTADPFCSGAATNETRPATRR